MSRLFISTLLCVGFLSAQVRVMEARLTPHMERIALHHLSKRRRDEHRSTDSRLGGSTTRAIVAAGEHGAGPLVSQRFEPRLALSACTGSRIAADGQGSRSPWRAPLVRRI
ncbi:MAG: hypothetical protein ACYCWW_12780 [Deltaproteobacteria bacterium]